MNFTLSGYLGGFTAQNDNATFTADFLNATSSTIGTAVIGPVLVADRNAATGLFFRSLSGLVPVGTQSVRLTLLMTRTDGTYNDGYADNLSFVLANGAPASTVPEPSTWALLGAGLLAMGDVARRRRVAC